MIEHEQRLQALLRDRAAPGEAGAEERAWRVVRAAAPQMRVRHGTRLRRLALAVSGAAVLLALSVTGPGEAVADWVRDAIDPSDHSSARPLTSLPTPGRLLVQSASGPWIVAADGSRRRIGPYTDSAWSPRGLFVAATRPHELAALDPKGNVRWSLGRRGAVRRPRWSPDGFRIAYLSGRSVRIVAGDGSGDVFLARSAATAPAWRPGGVHVLAFVDHAGSVRVVDTDSGRPLWRAASGTTPAQLQWSADGRRLLALSSGELRLFDARGRLLSRSVQPAGTRAVTAALAPWGHSFALVSRVPGATRSRLDLVSLAPGREQRRRVFAGIGRFTDVAWSPNGMWLVLGWPDADQWLFIRGNASGWSWTAVRKLAAVDAVSAQFTSGPHDSPAFPRIRGWCCTR